MILFVGQVETGMKEREAFQEIDYRAMFGTVAKWATEIEPPRPHPGDRRPRLRRGADRPARPGGGGAARGRALGRDRRAPGPRVRIPRAAPAERTSRARRLMERPSGRSSSRRRRLEPGRRDDLRAFAEANGCRC
jgi:hypothetical protein